MEFINVVLLILSWEMFGRESSGLSVFDATIT